MPVNLTKWKAYDELSSKNMNDKIIEVENYLNEREDANIKANKVIFDDGESFQQKLENNALRGPQGLQGNVDTTEIRQIKSEAEEHLRKAIQLLRSVQVNVEGTVLETQFMKKATFDKDNDGVVDNAKMLDGKGADKFAQLNKANVFTQSQSIGVSKHILMNLPSTDSSNAGIRWYMDGQSDIKFVFLAGSNNGSVDYIYMGTGDNYWVNKIFIMNKTGDLYIKNKVYSNNKELATLEYVQQLEQRIRALERKTQNL